MKLFCAEDVSAYLAQQNILTDTNNTSITQLSGGVSSSVWKIIHGDKRWVLKQALEKLLVKADWFSDVERIHREHEVMEILEPFLPARAVPEILHKDYINHIYMMSCAEDGARTWKEMLMAGEMERGIANDAGYTLQCIHTHSRKISEADRQKTGSQQYFVQLRIEPFHEYLIEQHPSLQTHIQKLIGELRTKRTCLVHGDFSPKNMLVENNHHFVLIDFEVAHWGNPVFDVAYCTGHLMLKGWHLNRKEDALQLVDTFLKSYGSAVDNLRAHTGLMLLARMDGKSPVTYITDELMKNNIREVAISWLTGEDDNDDLVDSIVKAYGLKD